MRRKHDWRGHEIEFKDGIWIYSDTKKSVESHQNRACGHCNKMCTKEGYDGCLGTLESVMNACCGHGKDDEAYIQFMDRSTISGNDALIVMRGDEKHT